MSGLCASTQIAVPNGDVSERVINHDVETRLAKLTARLRHASQYASGLSKPQVLRLLAIAEGSA